MLINELTLLYTSNIKAVLRYPTSHQPLILHKNELLKKANTEGIYFITTEENANKIMEESTIVAMPPIESYGIKNAFVFAGIPTFATILEHFGLQKKLVAIRIKPSYESLVRFTKFDNEQIFYDQIYVENENIHKIYLYLTYQDHSFIYKEFDYETREYHLKIAYKDVKKISKKMAIELKKYMRTIKKVEKEMQLNA